MLMNELSRQLPEVSKALEEAFDCKPSYVRSNFAMAQHVYKAQLIARAISAKAARIFLLSVRAEPPLIARVLSTSPNRRR